MKNNNQKEKENLRIKSRKKILSVIRQVKPSDLSELERIEKQCWPKSRRTNPKIIKARLEVYPEGQFVMERQGDIIGVVYSQRIQDKDQLHKMRTETSWKFHNKTGSVIQLLGVSVLPEFQGHGFGEQLLEHLLNHSRKIQGITNFIGVSFCKNYHQQTEKSFEEYIYSRDKYGFIEDPILRFHERLGGKVRGLLKGYRPDDLENESYGILIEYDIFLQSNVEQVLDLNPDNKGKKSKKPQNKDVAITSMHFLEDVVKNYLSPDNLSAYSPEIPLMEMGLDSTDLLNLRDQLNSHYKINLEPVFFFEHNNVSKIQKYFQEQQSANKTQKIVEDEDQNESTKSSDIAIIGMAFRLPSGINDPDSLLHFLRDGGNAIGSLPAGRWDWPVEVDLKSYPGINKGGFLEDIASFDAEHFRISPKEAAMMDPQQRFLLELTWEVLERAGYNRSKLSGSPTGVFIGASGSDYQRILDNNHIPTEGHSGLGNSMAILANRISYFYDFKGPSLCIDTACSSSLVALHEAVEALQQGKCEQALVGGIHLMCHPGNTLAYYKAGMLSPDGFCRSFDEKANGYVRSEGAILLLIKPLHKAIDDRDDIVAIIKGVACNHGGEASGLTVPNPKQQAALLKGACSQAGISPSNIGYIETHGTGTPLGDPIEISGIKEVYNEGSCAIGSIKSNFGHLEAAAGLAGLLKVVLSLKNKEIFKTVHFEKLNPHIKLGNNLFIAAHNQKWVVEKGKHRIGAVSSFGSGGTNAHAILEEFIPKGDAIISVSSDYKPSLILLSGKNRERLRESAQRLLEFIQDHKPLSMTELAYTLQVSRESLEERWGVIASSLEEIKEKLETYLVQENDTDLSQIKKNKDVVSDFETDEGLSKVVQEWIETKNYEKLLRFWLKGIYIDWSKLYREYKPKKIELPTYPFAKKKYWVNLKNTNRNTQRVLHPLVHQNTSTLSEQRFSSTFTGNEFFFKDHTITNQKVLPGVITLEMAREAIKLALGDLKANILLKNVVWARPIIFMSDPITIHIGLFPEDNGDVSYEIYTQKSDDEILVHSSGLTIVGEIRNGNSILKKDIESLISYHNKAFSSEDCYNAFMKMGFIYGPSLRGIQALYLRENSTLARIGVPNLDTQKEFELQPAIMDAALQAALISLGQEVLSDKPMIPFSLDTLELLSPCTGPSWAIINRSDAIQKFDIELCDEEGHVFLSMRGLSLRSLEKDKNIHEKSLKSHRINDDKLTRVPSSEKISQFLKTQLSSVLKLPIQKIDGREQLEKYGIDSIMATLLTEELEKTFGSLSKTLFFEYQTIDELSQYFLKHHSSELARILKLDEKKSFSQISQTASTDYSARTKLRHRSRFFNKSKEPLVNDEIAIIGISGRYPQSLNLKEFWENLRDGKDCITEVPSNRWDWRKYYDQSAKESGAHFSKWGGFIEGVDEFDPLFFNISPKDAIYLDPQERLFLEHAWMALEDSGVTRENLQRASLDDLPGQVGVYAGVMWSEYQLFGVEESLAGSPTSLWGSFSSIANRVSYFFNLHGPSIAVDTMCSSSLTSIHLACEDLKSGRTDAAIAGGVNVSIHPSKYLTLSTGQFISKDGHCQSFGVGGDGYIPGEGVGVVILKRFSNAVEDGDHIYGVIKGTAVNHGGKTNGYTVPNPNAQQMVISRALKESKVDPRTISYIEAHGTGTKLGDPIEITGLTKAFQASTGDIGYCALGSAKSNIGHCESAAGIAGVTKVLLQMQHGKIVPSLHSATLNPNIDFAKTPFIVNQQLKDWERPVIDGKEYPRIAGISSFGAGGSNAHIIIQEYTPPEVLQGSMVNEFNPEVILLSAKNGEQLKKCANQLLRFLKEKKEPLHLGEIAYTLQVGREPMEERLGIVVNSIKDLQEKLTAYTTGAESINGLYMGQVKKNKEMISDFESDAGFHNIIEGWLKQKDFEKLLKFWTRGLSIDWSKLYGAYKPRKISLPTYPFAKEKYWIDAGSTTTSEKIQTDTLDHISRHSEPMQTLYFETTLENKPLLLNSETQKSIKTMVCFLSNADQKRNFSKVLESSSKLIFISQGESFKKNSSEEYQIVSTDKETYEKAFTSILEEYGVIDALVYLWTEDDRQWIQNTFPIITIIQIIGRISLKTVQILLGGSFEDGLDHCWLESWIGIAHSVGFVLPNTTTRVIQHQQLPGEVWNWGTVIANELKAEIVSDVVYRHGDRYEYGIQPIHFSLEREVSSENRNSKKKTILITGGLGAIGFAFAKHLAATQQVNLILNGRSALNPKIENQIKEIERLGNSVIYLQADSGDIEGMRKGIEQAKLKFESIDGVIHAAGIESKESILTKSFSEFETILSPKIQGTLILDEILKEEPLDFISYFSSSSAILGDFGTCDYAMGNRFEMAYANYRNQLRDTGERKGRALVINWPLLKEGGMNFRDTKTTDFYIKTSGQDYLETKLALSIFDQFLLQSKNQLLVLVGYQSRVNQFLGLTKKTPTTVKSGSLSTSRGRKIEMRGLSVEECVILDLKEIASQILKIPTNRLDADTNLADFGFDSVSLAVFAGGIGKQYDLEIVPSVFFGYSTLLALAGYLLKEHLPTIHKFYQEESKEIANPEPRQAIYHKKEKPILPVRSDLNEQIAIIGMSGRFPDARNIEEMWEILREGKEAVHEIPLDRFDWREYFEDSTKSEQKTNCKWSGLIPGAGEFDPLFFEISPKEAEIIDPRQRHLLQESWKALEDAGYGVSDLKRQRIGMFVGVEEGDYSLFAKQHSTVTSGHNGILAARLAYFLNLSGAVMAINTACSSSLVAFHQACLALKNGEMDTAIVAGVNMLFTPELYVAMSQAGMLSNEGKCYAFDARANGMVPGEAIAVVVLKRLSDAERDCVPIRAIVRGSGLNYDGKTNGITAPNGLAQKELLTSIYEKNHIHPEKIEYFVAHGTGTSLGDPVEVNAISEVLKSATPRRGYCALTSTKTNFGHTFAASGLVSVISLVKALEEETIPGSLYCEEESPYIDWKNSPLYVNKVNRAWPVSTVNSYEDSRMGAVSAFGMSGTNAHVVLQGYLSQKFDQQTTLPYYILVISAKTSAALKIKIEEMVELLEKEDLPLAQVSYTLQEGRHHFKHRCALVIQDREGAIYGFKQHLKQERHPTLFLGDVPREFKKQKALELYLDELLDRIQYSDTDRDKMSVIDIFSVLADLYCQGYDIVWSKLYGNLKPKKISLPTYPFAKENYWLRNDENNLHKKITRQPIYLKLEWKNAHLPLIDASTEDPIHVLCTENQEDLFRQIKIFFVNAKKLTQEEIVQGISTGDPTVKGIIDIRSLDTSLKYPPDQTVMLLQKLIKETAEKPLRFLYFSFCDSHPNELLGLFEMLQSEYGYVASRHVALENTESIGSIAITEWETQQLETASKYKSGSRYVPVLNSVILKKEKLKLSKDDVVWITGGTRGLGRLAAQYFVEKYSIRKLVLHGATSFPSREDWNHSDLSNDIKDKIAAIRKLEARGVKVWITSVPLTDLKLLQLEVERVNQSLGNIGLVVHAAGVADVRNPAFIYKTMEGISRVLAPKVSGLRNLDLVMKDQNVKRFVLYSSISALIPSLGSGQSDYVMANSYLDQWIKKKQTYWLSIQWPSWKESGLGEVKSEAYKKTGITSHTDEEGLMLLDACLNQTEESIICPAIINPEQFENKVLMLSKIESSKVLKTVEVKNLDHKELQNAPVEKTEIWIQNLLSKFLKIETSKLDRNASFQEFGVDSIILVQIIKELDELLGGASLDPSIVLEYSTINQLAHYLVKTHQSPIKKHLEKSEEIIPNISYGRNPLARGLIAVVGMACHFPEAMNLESYWNNLTNGRDCIKEVPQTRWNTEKYFRSGEYQKGYSISRWGAFLEGIENFDPHYFNISEELASQMDPLARQWLEVSAEALADAGFERKSLWGQPVGVFVGTRVSNFSQKFKIDDMIKDLIVGMGQNFIGAHVSHFYNFKGPNMIIDAACASALTAIHQAVRSLQNGESRVALAGGVDILLDEEPYLKLSKAHILSQDGKCKPFDESANGIGLGEGCGILVLKTLSEAINDGNKIYGVIEGTAINNDGSTMGITTPNPEAQKDLIKQAINVSGISPESISYIEAHGTGTLIGDPIELKALTEIFRQRSSRLQFCGVGSVKSNLGHLLSAAGAAGIIKILLSMVHKQLPPTLHCQKSNPRFNFGESPFYPVLALRNWPNEIRRAGISAFGLGGHNAHIILSDNGIPSALRATLQPKSPIPRFNRKRYWPTPGQVEDTIDLSYLFEETNKV